MKTDSVTQSVEVTIEKAVHKIILMLIPALIAVESGGNWNAIGDNGRARGALQIHRACWQDGCEELGVQWDYETGAHDPTKAKAVCKAYLTRYGRAYERRTGRKATPEVLARIWNGGPTGYKKKATERYWRKVKTRLNWRRGMSDKPGSAISEAIAVIGTAVLIFFAGGMLGFEAGMTMLRKEAAKSNVAYYEVGANGKPVFTWRKMSNE